MSKLEQVVHEFFERRLLGECIDRLDPTPEQRVAQRADWFLWERSVVVEVKDLIDDRVGRVRDIIEKWRRRSDWPEVSAESDLQDVVRKHPRGQAVNEELFGVVTASIEGAFEKANRQLRETKRVYGLPDAQTLLVLVNEDVDLLDPRVFAKKLSYLFAKTLEDGSPRYPDIDGALIVSGAHTAVRSDGKGWNMVLAAVPPSAGLLDLEESLEGFIIKEWAAFIEKPLEHGGILQTAEDFDQLRLKGRRQPPVF